MVAGASWATYTLFHNPMCGLIFACGCTWSFRGGWKQCNVHYLGFGSSPRCPWCVSPRDTPKWTWTTGGAFTIAVMIMSWMLATFAISRPAHDHDHGHSCHHHDNNNNINDHSHGHGTYSALDSSVSPSAEKQPLTNNGPPLPCSVHTRSSKRAVCLRRIVPFFAFFWHHAIVGLAFAIGTGYPYYFFFHLPNTQPPSWPLPPFINASALAIP